MYIHTYDLKFVLGFEFRESNYYWRIVDDFSSISRLEKSFLITGRGY